MTMITAVEAMKLRSQCTFDMLSVCIDLADIHICYPANANRDDFYSFLCTVFNAGRIDGIRQERARRSKGADHE